jgi:hypothetical protein
MALTAAKAAHAAEMLKRAKTQMEKVRETTEETVSDTLMIAETSGTAFGLAYANERWGEHGELRVLGMPVDLGIATALSGLALFGGLGKYKEHGRNIGAGALATYAARVGGEKGKSAAQDEHDDAYKRALSSGRPAGALGAGSASSSGSASTKGAQEYVVADR